MPLIETLTKIIIFGIMSGVLLQLVSSGKVEQKAYIGYYIFGILWMLELANAVGSFVISYSVVSWYYIPHPKTHNWCGLTWGYIYAVTFHLGTLALGSLLIAILRLFRIIMSILANSEEA